MRLTNDFHQTEAHATPCEEGFLTARQVRRIRQQLCGVDGCTCGENCLGTRGMHLLIVNECTDGGVQLYEDPPY